MMCSQGISNRSSPGSLCAGASLALTLARPQVPGLGLNKIVAMAERASTHKGARFAEPEADPAALIDSPRMASRLPGVLGEDGISPSKPKVSRQFPLTDTAYRPARLPAKACSPHPGTFISAAVLAKPSRASCRLSRAAWCGWMPALEPVSKKSCSPLCRNVLIIPRNCIA